MKCPIQSGMKCPSMYRPVGVRCGLGRFNSGGGDAKLCSSNELKSKKRTTRDTAVSVSPETDNSQ